MSSARKKKRSSAFAFSGESEPWMALRSIDVANNSIEVDAGCVLASIQAAAAEKGGSKSGPIKMTLNVTVTRIPQVGAWVCVGIEGFGTFCRLERQD